MNLCSKIQVGDQLYYYLAGKFGIHPTYIQEMINIKLSENKMLEGISQLKNYGASRYDVNLQDQNFKSL